jgi:hypothetical protein
MDALKGNSMREYNLELYKKVKRAEMEEPETVPRGSL